MENDLDIHNPSLQNFLNTPLVDRMRESRRIREKYRDRIPVLIDIDRRLQDRMKKFKYLVPMEHTLATFFQYVKSKVIINPIDALYVTANDAMPPLSYRLDRLYQEFPRVDGFMLLKFRLETSFGQF